MPISVICTNCDFFIETGTDEGDCRRLPPYVLDRHDRAKFPKVLKEWWCGEWENEETETPEPVYGGMFEY